MGGSHYVFSPRSRAGKGTCGMWSSRHSIAIRAFLVWQLGCSGLCKMSLSMPRESLIRNKHNGFSLERQLSSLACFWF